MKITLIQAPVPELKDDRLDPPVGLLYLAGAAKKSGHDASVLDLSGMEPTAWGSAIPASDFYGISTYTANYHIALEVLELARQISPGAKTIAGGSHATALPEDVRKDFDYVVTGEGEIVLPRILSRDVPPGIIAGEPVSDLDSLPFPDNSLVHIESYTRLFEGKRAFQIFASRGCPYRCAFCTTTIKRVRRRSPENVVAEIESLRGRYADVSFRFKDDLFAQDAGWLRQFAEICPDIEYSCNIRADCNPLAIKYLRKTGCKWACIGIESGSDRMLKQMRKGTTVAKARSTIRALQHEGIKVLGWFIAGFPGETWDTIAETKEFIREMDLDKVVIYPLIPYPGTAVWQEREKFGLRIIDDDFSHYFYIHGNYEAGFVYETDELTPDIIRAMRDELMQRSGEGAQP